eukprot:2424399-Lingulodinium_polyedra.AAC.1
MRALALLATCSGSSRKPVEARAVLAHREHQAEHWHDFTHDSPCARDNCNMFEYEAVRSGLRAAVDV